MKVGGDRGYKIVRVTYVRDGIGTDRFQTYVKMLWDYTPLNWFFFIVVIFYRAWLSLRAYLSCQWPSIYYSINQFLASFVHSNLFEGSHYTSYTIVSVSNTDRAGKLLVDRAIACTIYHLSSNFSMADITAISNEKLWSALAAAWSTVVQKSDKARPTTVNILTLLAVQKRYITASSTSSEEICFRIVRSS